jgi:hypothetical protein
LGSLDTIISFFVFLVAAGMLLIFSITGKKKSRGGLRSLPAITQLKKALGSSVEQGKRVHITLGSVNLMNPNSAASVSALNASEKILQHIASGDKAPIVTSGDGALTLLAQDELSGTYRQANAMSQFNVNQGQMVGVSPWTYAAGTLAPIREKANSTNVLLGHFGPEAALILDAAEKNDSFYVAGSDDLAGQAVMYAAAQESLIGEEVYAVAPYFQPGGVQRAGLKVQDVLRWTVICVLVIAAFVRLVLSILGIGI